MGLTRLKHTVLAVITVTLSACGGGADNDKSSYIPGVQLECSSAQASDCSATGKVVFVGYIESLVLSCASTLNGLTASQRQQLFVVTGYSVSTRSGIYLTAVVDQWYNNSGGSQDVLNPGTYQVCSFVDTNGNGKLDTGEPVSSGQTDTGAGTYTLNSWASAP